MPSRPTRSSAWTSTTVASCRATRGSPAYPRSTPSHASRVRARSSCSTWRGWAPAPGPDVETIAEIHAAFPELELLAGGGVRDADDLRALEDAGAAGALVATALLSGAI